MLLRLGVESVLGQVQAFERLQVDNRIDDLVGGEGRIYCLGVCENAAHRQLLNLTQFAKSLR